MAASQASQVRAFCTVALDEGGNPFFSVQSGFLDVTRFNPEAGRFRLDLDPQTGGDLTTDTCQVMVSCVQPQAFGGGPLFTPTAPEPVIAQAGIGQDPRTGTNRIWVWLFDGIAAEDLIDAGFSVTVLSTR